MLTRNQKIKQLSIFSLAAIQLVFVVAPAAVTFAQDAGADASNTGASTQAPPEHLRGPTGASAHMYTYVPETNMWESEYYIWNPHTLKRTPKYDIQYIYNSDTEMWEQTNWVYSPSAGTYKASVSSLPYDPYGGPIEVEPAPTVSNSGPSTDNGAANPHGTDATVANTGPESHNLIDNPYGPTSISDTGPYSDNQANLGAIDQTGPYSRNIIGYDEYGNVIYDVQVSIDVDNNVRSHAQTGDASILQNTLGGSAITGDAYADTNILNMIQSTVGIQGAVPNLYTANIQGDHVGDIVIDPNLLLGGARGASDNLEVNIETDATIDNNVDLYAGSGNAEVSNNTEAGDATSGDAVAVANVINLINSAITTGESFIGVLNIHGNLEGDVLVADDVIDQLIAANVPTSTVCLCGDETKLQADIDNDQKINNNITTTATSGEAAVGYNTSAGSAISGDADTNVTVFNLTGQQVLADSAILVFVNVLGEWVGFITDAPEGSTAALFGNSVQPSQPLAYGGSAEFDIDNDFEINNNLNLVAETGNADVSANTLAGNAATGDAHAAANVSNITNSNFTLDSWFGLLFINVFGGWSGSFGEDTPYGNPVSAVGGDSIVYEQPTGVATSSKQAVAPSSTSNNGGGTDVRIYELATSQSESDEGQIEATQVAAPAAATVSKPATAETPVLEDASAGGMATLLITVGASGLVLLVGERLFTFARSRSIGLQ